MSIKIIFFTIMLFITSIDTKIDNINKLQNHQITIAMIETSKTKLVTKSINDSLRNGEPDLQKESPPSYTQTSISSSSFYDVVSSIFVSIIAGIIFWALFTLLPEYQRKRKIRPKLALDIYEVYSSLFKLFDLVMRDTRRSPSFFQSKIRGGLISRSDLELGLQNKCQNETYIFDSALPHTLLPIGESIYSIINEMNLSIKHLYSFTSFLTAKEIILLERIRKTSHTYPIEDYAVSAISIINGEKMYPANPSLSYMSNNIYELYLLFLEIQNVIFKNKYLEKEVLLDKVQFYYNSEQYEKCKKTIQKSNSANDKTTLRLYYAMTEYKLAKKESVLLILADVLKDKPDLISYRNFLKDLYLDKKVNAPIKDIYTESEILDLSNIIQSETLVLNNFTRQANNLKAYYNEKTTKI